MIGSASYKTINVLFICAHNSARSILAEALLNRLGAGRFEAYSAGIDPVPAISPYALALLHKINYNTGKLTTKGLEIVESKWTPKFDFVIRLCDEIPNKSMPQFAGHPVFIDWFLSNPCDVVGSSAVIAAAYADIFNTLANRIDILAHMSDEALSHPNIAERLQMMGEEHHRLAA